MKNGLSEVLPVEGLELEGPMKDKIYFSARLASVSLRDSQERSSETSSPPSER